MYRDLCFTFSFLPQSIRSALVSRILPAVTTCSLISVKFGYRKNFDASKANPEDLRLEICNKRDECDEAVKRIPGVAFFFSAVAAIESRVKQDEGNENTVEVCGDNNSNRQKKVVYWPAISYSIAVQSQNGAHVSTLPFHSALLETEMEVS